MCDLDGLHCITHECIDVSPVSRKNAEACGQGLCSDLEKYKMWEGLATRPCSPPGPDDEICFGSGVFPSIIFVTFQCLNMSRLGAY